MKLSKFFGIILALGCIHGAVAQKALDTIWACHDSIDELSPKYLFFRMFLADTFPDNRGKFSTVDTGDSHDGSKYVNFDYQFTSSNNGYAGFKFYWDNGFVKFYTVKHDSMFLWHKGPLPGHKVKMIWAQGGECGEPINYEYFGEFKSSTEWKRECFPFPQKRGYVSKSPDSAFVKDGLFELRMLIYREDSTSSPTSEKGCLKLDDIGFIKNHSSAIRDFKDQKNIVENPHFFIPISKGQVALSIYSLQGEQLFKALVPIEAGKRYNIGQFARKNSNLPARYIQCVKIAGSGVNISTRICR